jgi:hypothetical protein
MVKGAVIILEVEKRSDGSLLEKLLGEHKWKDMLLDPDDDETGVSQIFPCLHTNREQVRKDGRPRLNQSSSDFQNCIGWRSVDVEPKWFHGWSPENE